MATWLAQVPPSRSVLRSWPGCWYVKRLRTCGVNIDWYCLPFTLSMCNAAGMAPGSGMWLPFQMGMRGAGTALSLSLAPSLAFPLLCPFPDSWEFKWKLVMIGMQKAGRMSLEFSREAHAQHPKWLPASVASGQCSMPDSPVFFRKVRLHDVILPFPSARGKSRGSFLFSSPGSTSDHILGAKHLCMSVRFVCIPTPSLLKKW